MSTMHEAIAAIRSGGSVANIANLEAVLYRLAGIFNTVAEVAAADIPSDLDQIELRGYAAAGDGGHGRYVRDAAASVGPGVLESNDGALWRLIDRPIAWQQFGITGDAAWAAMASYVETEYAAGRWHGEEGGELGGYEEAMGGQPPGRITGRFGRCTLTQPVAFQAPVLLDEMLVLMDEGAEIVLDHDATVDETVLSHGLGPTFCAVYIGAADSDKFMVRIPACFCVRIEGTTFSGNKTYRARGGVFLGEERAWNVTISGGRHNGGEVPLWIGYGGDHTGISMEGVAVDHGRVANLVLCGVNGFAAKGCNIEHAHGTRNVVIMSETSAGNPAQNVSFENCYMYNDGYVDGYDSDGVIITAGEELPGTEGWFGAGALQSAATGEGLTLRNCYMVSNNVHHIGRFNMLARIDISNIRWVNSASGGAAFVFSGSCAHARIRDTRHQNTGNLRPSIASTATNPILVDFPMSSWSPQLKGETTDGSHTYSFQSGRAVVQGNWATVNVAIVGSTPVGGAGDVIIPLPEGYEPAAASRAVSDGYTYLLGYEVVGFIAAGLDHIRLYKDDGTTRLNWSDLVAATGEYGFHFTFSYPIDAAD